MIIDFATTKLKDRYKIISTTIIPRPIAWIVTDSDGVINVAPFSYFTPLSSNPATVIVSIGHKIDGSQKDTLKNILTTKKATICFVNEKLKDKMEKSAESLAFGESESEVFGIETEVVKDGFPPMIKDTESALFCDFLKIVELEGKTVPLILEIDSCYFKDEVYVENLHINLSNIGRVANDFVRLEKI